MQLLRKQGRPLNYGQAMSAAERARDYQRKRKEESIAYHGQCEKKVRIAVTIDTLDYGNVNSEAD
ncbi:hypothetical protein, partial [Xanthomonas perforans]|uniref:hypothetical protein n=1 Tax=Xanthomonas perforans TaxID=442694 RepID=UPI001F1726C8